MPVIKNEYTMGTLRDIVFILDAMRVEAKVMAGHFEKLSEDKNVLNDIHSAISSMSSKQAALCSIILAMLDAVTTDDNVRAN